MLFHTTDVFSTRQPTELLFLMHTDCPKASHTLFASHAHSPLLWMQRSKGLHNARNLVNTHLRKAHGRAPYPLLQPPHFRQVISFLPSVIQHNLTSFHPYEPPILLRAHQHGKSHGNKISFMGTETRTRFHSCLYKC